MTSFSKSLRNKDTAQVPGVSIILIVLSISLQNLWECLVNESNKRSRGKCISQPRACSILYLPHNGRAVKVCDMWMRWRQQPEIELLKCQSRFLLLWNCQALTTSLSRGAAPWAREWGTFSQVKCSWALCATTNRNPIHEYEKCSSIGNRSVALPYGLCWAADIGSLWLPMGKAPAYACVTLFIGISIKDHMSSLTIFSCVKQLSMFWEKNGN